MSKTHASVAIHIAAILFGLTGIFGTLISASPTVITAGRAAFAVIALIVFIRLQGFSVCKGLNARSLVPLFLAGGMLAAHWVTFFIAVKVGGIAVATLGFASFPAFITIGEKVFFDEKVKQTEWITLLLITIGLILVTPSFDFTDKPTAGLIWAILSGLTFAIFTLINRRAANHIPAQQVACVENFFVVLFTLPFAAAEISTISNIDWLLLSLLGVLCTALSHYLLVASLMVLKARSAGIVIALEPVYAILFAAVLFAQYPPLRSIVGGLIMIGAILWSSTKKHGHT